MNDPQRTDPEVLRLKAFSWLSGAELTVFSHGRALANFKRHGVISGEIGLASEAYILLAGATKVPCLNAPRERVAVGPRAARRRTCRFSRAGDGLEKSCETS